MQKAQSKVPWLAYAIGVLTLLLAGWLGLPYLRGGGNPTVTPTTPTTPTTASAVAMATDTTLAPVDTTTLLAGMPHNPRTGTVWKEASSGMEFVFVPARKFAMGSTEAQIDDALALCKKYSSTCERSWYEDEKPAHIGSTAAYWIGKTEVSNAHFRRFIEGDGYKNQAYWTEAGWQWRNENNVTQPDCWNESDFNGDNQPVVCVSWYEAIAYTRWLSNQSGVEVRLPSEAEWEKAARGTDGRIYPWGNEEPTADLLNFNYNVGKTTDVGSYPKGASPYGALDMAGNVREWNSTQYKAYPYDAGDGREELKGNDSRLLRGGSFKSNPHYVRGADRNGDFAVNRFDDVGFRVVVSVSPGS